MYSQVVQRSTGLENQLRGGSCHRAWMFLPQRADECSAARLFPILTSFCAQVTSAAATLTTATTTRGATTSLWCAPVAAAHCC